MSPLTTPRRSIAIIGAPSSIGIRPYDDGTPRRLDLAPNALREQGLVARLGARDRGDVIPAPYRDLVRPPDQRPRNETDVAAYSAALATHVVAALTDGAFLVMLGGDCSIVLGALLGARQATRGHVGLAYIDAHADFATPQLSRTGSVASMCLALAVGLGDTPLARLAGSHPLVRPHDAALLGRRDHADAPAYGQGLLKKMAILDVPHAELRAQGAPAAAQSALERLTHPSLAGFWIHVDADVLDPAVLPAVDSPEPDGLSLDELVELLTPLVRHPSALGLELTIYDPALDPDRTSAARLAHVVLRAPETAK